MNLLRGVRAARERGGILRSDAPTAQPATPDHGGGIAFAIGAIGLVYAWPIDSLVPILDPLTDIIGSVGLTMDRELAYLCLFASPEPAGGRLAAPGHLSRPCAATTVPTARTIIVSIMLILVGLLGTYEAILPDMVGILAFVAATAIPGDRDGLPPDLNLSDGLRAGGLLVRPRRRSATTAIPAPMIRPAPTASANIAELSKGPIAAVA